MAKYHIYTDGSSRGNPGKGGWATIVLSEDEGNLLFAEHDTEEQVTNNRMELKAMICALGYAESHPRDQFIIYSDSAYVVNSCNVWMRNWAMNGWRNSKKQTVENVDLMKALWDYMSREFPNFEICQCKGHNGDVGNELADALATGDIKRFNDLSECWLNSWVKLSSDSEDGGDNWFPID